ncbi:MAG: hypothetical protein C4543_07480 [Ignavibacteriales bacterium]|nr:MAG: hypothetical protein C4543_07480 [Ignavibacteriales bacterium]
MKKILFTLIIATSIFAQSAGSSGLSFLKSGFNARNIAMGDLGVASAHDVSALYYNPALLADYVSPQLTFSHNQLMQDVSGQMLGASFPLFGLPFAFGLNTTSVSGFEMRTRPGEPESTFNVHFFNASLSTGFYLYEKLSFGMTVKYLYENLFSDDASGLGFDLGVSYKNIIEGLDLGLSYRNMGSMEKLRNVETELPTDLRIGAAYNFPLTSIQSDITLTGGMQKYTKSEDTHLHVGAEIFYDNLIALRGGYMSGYESKGLTAGLGLLWNGINFDYAFVPYDYGLGDSHIISLMYTF